MLVTIYFSTLFKFLLIQGGDWMSGKTYCQLTSSLKHFQVHHHRTLQRSEGILMILVYDWSVIVLESWLHSGLRILLIILLSWQTLTFIGKFVPLSFSVTTLIMVFFSVHLIYILEIFSSRDPEWADVKLAQAKYLLSRLAQFKIAVSDKFECTPSVLVAGDFNSTPGDKVCFDTYICSSSKFFFLLPIFVSTLYWFNSCSLFFLLLEVSLVTLLDLSVPRGLRCRNKVKREDSRRERQAIREIMGMFSHVLRDNFCLWKQSWKHLKNLFVTNYWKLWLKN